MLRKDSLRLGILLGFLAPILGMFIYYFIQFRMFTLEEFFTIMFQQKTLLTGIVSISLIANAVVFTLYINTRKDRTARGIFISTCIYAIAALLWKVVG
jgi:tryptophan-rich sensory protein